MYLLQNFPLFIAIDPGQCVTKLRVETKYGTKYMPAQNYPYNVCQSALPSRVTFQIVLMGLCDEYLIRKQEIIVGNQFLGGNYPVSPFKYTTRNRLNAGYYRISVSTLYNRGRLTENGDFVLSVKPC